MVAERLTDGVRIGQLLASEITGNEGRLRTLLLADADPDVEPTADGALAYAVVAVNGEKNGAGTDLVAEAYVQPDRLRLEFVRSPDAVADAATEAGLRVRPKAVRPPRTLVFVEDGAQVKRVLSAFEASIRPADAGDR